MSRQLMRTGWLSVDPGVRLKPGPSKNAPVIRKTVGRALMADLSGSAAAAAVCYQATIHITLINAWLLPH